jgi:hypothetical protein
LIFTTRAGRVSVAGLAGGRPVKGLGGPDGAATVVVAAAEVATVVVDAAVVLLDGADEAGFDEEDAPVLALLEQATKVTAEAATSARARRWERCCMCFS